APRGLLRRRGDLGGGFDRAVARGVRLGGAARLSARVRGGREEARPLEEERDAAARRRERGEELADLGGAAAQARLVAALRPDLAPRGEELQACLLGDLRRRREREHPSVRRAVVL